MPKDVMSRGDYYEFVAYLHMSPNKGVRHTKTPSGSYSNERMCSVVIKVPKSAFKAPEFRIGIEFKGGTEIDPIEFKESVDNALEALPVIVMLSPTESKE